MLWLLWRRICRDSIESCLMLPRSLALSQQPGPSLQALSRSLQASFQVPGKVVINAVRKLLTLEWDVSQDEAQGTQSIPGSLWDGRLPHLFSNQSRSNIE